MPLYYYRHNGEPLELRVEAWVPDSRILRPHNMYPTEVRELLDFELDAMCGELGYPRTPELGAHVKTFLLWKLGLTVEKTG